MGKSWRSLPNRGLNVSIKEEKMKVTHCSVCNNKTYQEDCVCVLCRNYITRMHEELIALLTIDKNRKIRAVKVRRR